MINRVLFFLFLLVNATAAGQETRTASTGSDAGGQNPDALRQEFGQHTAFCEALTRLLDEAALDFERIRGKATDTTTEGTRWTVKSGLPGMISSAVFNVTRVGWQYEGTVYLGDSMPSMKQAFDQYRTMLGSCLLPQGYTVTVEQNHTPSLSDYPETRYNFTHKKDSPASPQKTGSKPRTPYVLLRAEFTEVTNTYVVTVSVWNNY